MVKDFLGREIVAGAIVLRSKYSSFTIHRVLGFTDKSIVLSVKKTPRTCFIRHYNGGRYSITERESFFIVDTTNVVEIEDHNSKLYYCKTYSKTGLIII